MPSIAADVTVAMSVFLKFMAVSFCRLTVDLESLEFGGGKRYIAPPVYLVQPEVEYLFADGEIVERSQLARIRKPVSLFAFVGRNGRVHQEVRKVHPCGRGVADE